MDFLFCCPVVHRLTYTLACGDLPAVSHGGFRQWIIAIVASQAISPSDLDRGGATARGGGVRTVSGGVRHR